MDLFTYEDNSVLRSVIRGIVYVVVLISLAWFLVYAFMGQTIINGQSMSPLLNAEDVCLVDRSDVPAVLISYCLNARIPRN